MKYKLALALFSTVVAGILGAWFFLSGQSRQLGSALFIFSGLSLLVSVLYLLLYRRMGKNN